MRAKIAMAPNIVDLESRPGFASRASIAFSDSAAADFFERRVDLWRPDRGKRDFLDKLGSSPTI
jgi:hypothetical protein